MNIFSSNVSSGLVHIKIENKSLLSEFLYKIIYYDICIYIFMAE